MKSVVKEMKRHNQSCKETEGCNREVLQEATVINSLGDHPNLGLYGKRAFPSWKSITLHEVVKARMLKKQWTTKVFQDSGVYSRQRISS